MPLVLDQIDDFVNLTLSNFKKQKWTDLSLELNSYMAQSLINDKKVMEQGGKDINFKIKVRNSGNARNVGLYAQDVTNVEDMTISASVPWTYQTTNYSYDIYEDLFQSDKETIIKEMVMRDHSAMCDLVELDEENLWTKPINSSDKRPFGIPYWVVKSTTTPEGAFTGGNPVGFTAGAAGVDSNSYARWKNWAFQYTQPTRDDLVRKLKKAMTFTQFKAPVPHPELGLGASDHVIFTTYRTLEPLQRLAEDRNDNHGNDVARFMNEVVVNGVPIRLVYWLEANDTDDPLYGIDFGKFRPFVKTGVDMRRNPPKIAARQHNVREVHIDRAMNYICYNRRNMFVGSK